MGAVAITLIAFIVGLGFGVFIEGALRDDDKEGK